MEEGSRLFRDRFQRIHLVEKIPAGKGKKGCQRVPTLGRGKRGRRAPPSWGFLLPSGSGLARQNTRDFPAQAVTQAVGPGRRAIVDQVLGKLRQLDNPFFMTDDRGGVSLGMGENHHPLDPDLGTFLSPARGEVGFQVTAKVVDLRGDLLQGVRNPAYNGSGSYGPACGGSIPGPGLPPRYAPAGTSFRCRTLYCG